MPYKPDWHAAEVTDPRRTDYYDSDRALGHLYRAIEIDDPAAILSAEWPNNPPQTILTDSISVALEPRVQKQLQSYMDPERLAAEIRNLFRLYVDELAYICLTHTLSSTNDVRLKEEEIVVGTILAKCSQRRWRKDRMHRMRAHSSVLVQEVQRELMNSLDKSSTNEIRKGLTKAWNAWDFSLRHSTDFGANSFGLIALGIIFDCLEKLDEHAKVQETSFPILTVSDL
jgi:RNA-dependent RNA polymerase